MKQFGILVLVILIILGCTENKKGKHNSNQQKIVTNTEPRAGKYFYDILNETSFQFSFNQNENETINKTHVGIEFEISTDSLNQRNIKVKYNKILMYSKAGETVTELDAKNGASSFIPEEKLLNVLLSQQIEYKLDSNGNVIQEVGLQNLRTNMLQALNSYNINQREQINKQLDQLLAKGFFKDNLDFVLKNYLKDSLKQGDSWEANSELPGEINFTANSRFHVKDMDGGIATIIESGDFDCDHLKVPMSITNLKASIHGKQSGTHVLDLATNMLLSTSYSMKGAGMIEMMGREVPIKFKTQISVKQEGEHNDINGQ